MKAHIAEDLAWLRGSQASSESFLRVFSASSSQSHAVLITYPVVREHCFGAAQSHSHLEITMNTKAPVFNTTRFICIALLAACGVPRALGSCPSQIS